MNKSKFRQSILKLNQNEHQISQHLNYIPLIYFKNGHMIINNQGLSILQQINHGQLYIIGVYSLKKSIINIIYHNNNILPDDKNQIGIWITNYPRYNHQNHHKYLYLYANYTNKEEYIKIHTLCSVICSTILIDLHQIDHLAFLISVETRIIYSIGETNKEKNIQLRKKQLTNLIFIQKSKNKQGILDLKRSSRQLNQILTHFKIEKQLYHIYSNIVLLKLSSDTHQYENREYIPKFEEEIKAIANLNKKNEDLRSGPILRQYLQILVSYLNNHGMIDISNCTKDIKISQGYNGYINSIQYYHKSLKRQLKQQGIPNIREKLKQSRLQTIDEYNKYSNDSKYLIKLNEYIDQTQQKLINQNNKQLDIKNINYLKQTSSSFIKKIKNQKLTQNKILPILHSIIEQYKLTAYGDHKYQILTNFIDNFYQQSFKNVQHNQIQPYQLEINTLRTQNTSLQARLDTLRKQNSKKCCEIM